MPDAAGLEFRLLNDFQRDFPLVAEPYAELARRLDVAPALVLETLARLQGEGSVSRIGAVFAPGRVGASTLAAMAVPPPELERIAALVSARPGVNHNYEREHALNLWFVAAARDPRELADLLADIERQTGHAVVSLPLEREFHIDLGFDLRGAPRRRGGRAQAPGQPRPLSSAEEALVRALQPGLALVPRPFERLAAEAGLTGTEVLSTLEAWCAEGFISRFGIVVRHRELGYQANAMVVWDLPDEAVEATGRALAEAPAVTLCYQRRRARPVWPYNLFVMIHGRSRAWVEGEIEHLRQAHGLAGHASAVLFSRRCFTQRGARHLALEAGSRG